MIDVDGLKSINDRLGHRAGDAAINLVADALKKGCRTEDVAARWGGDEFVLLAPHTNVKQAEILSRRICAAVRAQAALNSADAQAHGQPSAPWVTVSVGYAIAEPDKAATLMASTLFAEADQAMYRRKASRAAPTAPLALHFSDGSEAATRGAEGAELSDARDTLRAGEERGLPRHVHAVVSGRDARSAGAAASSVARFDVVRHVTAIDAAAWGMEPGCVLQLLDATPTLNDAIARIMNGGRPGEPAAVIDSDLRHLLRAHLAAEREDY